MANSERPRLPSLFCEHKRTTREKWKEMLKHLKSHETALCTRGHPPNQPQPEPQYPGMCITSAESPCFAIVVAAHDGLLPPASGLGRRWHQRSTAGLAVLQVLPSLGGLGLATPLLVQFMELGLHVLGSKMACRAGREEDNEKHGDKQGPLAHTASVTLCPGSPGPFCS